MRGHAWLLGGMCGCWEGVCMVAGGACVVAGGGGMHGCWGACMVARGHAWLQGGMRGIRRDAVNERAARILLECILVHIERKRSRFQQVSCPPRAKTTLTCAIFHVRFCSA